MNGWKTWCLAIEGCSYLSQLAESKCVLQDAVTGCVMLRTSFSSRRLWDGEDFTKIRFKESWDERRALSNKDQEPREKGSHFCRPRLQQPTPSDLFFVCLLEGTLLQQWTYIFLMFSQKLRIKKMIQICSEENIPWKLKFLLKGFWSFNRMWDHNHLFHV